MEDEKVAVKSGYYMDFFSKSEIPKTLKKSDKQILFNNKVYDLYEGTSLEDERAIDEMFGDNMGYLTEAHIYTGEIKEKIKPKCRLIGEDGNIYNLMGIAFRTLRRNGMELEAKEMIMRIENSKNYYEALNVIQDYVEVTGEEEWEEEEEF